TETEASLPDSSGSSVCEVVAAASVTVPPMRASGAVAESAKTASAPAASPSALQDTTVLPASKSGASQLQPAGAATARSGSSASNTKPTPGNTAASGPALATTAPNSMALPAMTLLSSASTS